MMSADRLAAWPFASPGTPYHGNSTRSTQEMRDWLLSASSEVALEPDMAIIDPHHHLMDKQASNFRYLFDDLLEDISSGHRVLATVFVDSGAMYRSSGPDSLRPIGEVEFARGVAAMASSGRYGKCRVAEAIVGRADLRLGARVDEVLEAAIDAGGGRYRGVRHSATFHDGVIGRYIPNPMPANLLGHTDFRAGYARLKAYNLSFDAWIFHTQLAELIKLADDFPDVPVALNHIGAPLGVGPYAGLHDVVFKQWSTSMRQLSERDNVFVKIGGMGMPLFGFRFHVGQTPPGSEALAAAWRPYVDQCIALFGPKRCMFESNFPMDKQSYGYSECWNAFKRLTVHYSTDERRSLFRETAASFYRLELD